MSFSTSLCPEHKLQLLNTYFFAIVRCVCKLAWIPMDSDIPIRFVRYAQRKGSGRAGCLRGSLITTSIISSWTDSFKDDEYSATDTKLTSMANVYI